MDISAALETEINDSGLESSATEDVAEALSSLPRINGTPGTSSDDNKFQSAIAAWRSISAKPFIADPADGAQTSISQSLCPSSTIQLPILLRIKEML